GDLTSRKLVPALYYLYREGMLPEGFSVVGAARSTYSDDEFRSDLRGALKKYLKVPAEDEPFLDRFLEKVSYISGNFGERDSYQGLIQRLDSLDEQRGTQGNRLFYMSTPPSFFAPIVNSLRETGLANPKFPGKSWTRVVIEKPFGHDLESARELNRLVMSVFSEDQVYRIDHYLGKETVQNILAFRFGNSIFEPIWNRRHVAAVQITVAEEVGMAGGRGSYYDTAGAIRDMVQNHMMQLLSLVAMEPPVDLSADAVRNEKVKVLQTLPDWKPDDVYRNVVRAQYTAGSIEGVEVPGYLQEKGVAPDSKTAPYVAMRLVLNTWRWAGVPFFLRTGKRLPKRATEIAIQLHRPPTELFELEGDGHSGANQLVMRIQPNEGASLSFEAKIPGSRRRLQEVRMDFRYGTAFAVPPPEAYERLLLDVMLGDPTLFTRTDEVESAWRFITAILDAWQQPGAPPPVNYVAGSWGPEAADELLKADGSKWRRL
ncbi:MAG: glucose-6-phosphate dehydrogenase, partial [Planctomycetaceae bacterium]|nr:glucose-6-phosphate dehydrogenase [Planctomycetaceae bacterium]